MHIPGVEEPLILGGGALLTICIIGFQFWGALKDILKHWGGGHMPSVPLWFLRHWHIQCTCFKQALKQCFEIEHVSSKTTHTQTNYYNSPPMLVLIIVIHVHVHVYTRHYTVYTCIPVVHSLSVPSPSAAMNKTNNTNSNLVYY